MCTCIQLLEINYTHKPVPNFNRIPHPALFLFIYLFVILLLLLLVLLLSSLLLLLLLLFKKQFAL